MTPLQKGLLKLLGVARLARAPGLERARILAVQVAGMGDLLLAVPALRALRASFPGARVDLLTSSRAGGAAAGCPYLGTVLALEARGFQGNHSPLRWREALPLIRRIRRSGYDLALNLIGLYTPQGAVRMGLLLRSLGIPLLAGRDTLGTGTFFHLALEENLEAPRNERDTNLALARLLGAEDPQGGKLEAWPTPEEEGRAEEMVRSLPGEGPLVGVNPGSDRPEKAWPEDCFRQVMEALRRERGARFILTGGPAEGALTRRLAGAMGEGALDTVGRVSFHGTAALLRRLDLFLTTDTAALHLAWAAEAPAVALFRTENLGRYRPATDRIECLTGPEDAALRIDPLEVLRACRARLDRPAAKPGAEGGPAGR
jgi:heptosyltransferase-2